MKMATAGRRVSESESSEEISSSSSDYSLLTDAGHISLQPYMHEPPATSSTYRRKVDQSASQHTGPGYRRLTRSRNAYYIYKRKLTIGAYPNN